MRSIELGYGVVFRIFDEERYVETVFPDNFRIGATRPPTPENVQEARDQGYLGQDHEACWWSLVEHEIGHTLVGRQMFGRESVVLRHEAGADLAPYGRRLLEEGVVISVQHFMNRDLMDDFLCDRGLPKVAMQIRTHAISLLGPLPT